MKGSAPKAQECSLTGSIPLPPLRCCEHAVQFLRDFGGIKRGPSSARSQENGLVEDTGESEEFQKTHAPK